jgi:hypothetical protein
VEGGGMAENKVKREIYSTVAVLTLIYIPLCRTKSFSDTGKNSINRLKKYVKLVPEEM